MTRFLLRMSFAALTVFTGTAFAQSPAVTPAPFHWHDDYTEYHLLDPATNQFHIVYFLNQRQAGLAYVLNQTRSGSAGSDISVTDPRTGAPLKFDYMTGKELVAAGVPGRLAPEEHYIRAHLARPVPEGGEGRVRIEKTYKDEKSYFATGDTIRFARSLGIGRNAIVLPVDYKLVSSNVAAIVESLGDGRMRVSFENVNGYASDVNIVAAKSAAVVRTHYGGGTTPASTSRKTLYVLNADGTVGFTHDHVAYSGPTDGNPEGVTLVRPNIVPPSQSAGIRAVDLDTGDALALMSPSENRLPTVQLKPSQVRVQSAAIRFTGTFRDPNLILRPIGFDWTRELLEPRATVVFPAGYELAHANVPVTMGTLGDGRVYLQVVNARPASMVRLEVRGVKVR